MPPKRKLTKKTGPVKTDATPPSLALSAALGYAGRVVVDDAGRWTEAVVLTTPLPEIITHPICLKKGVPPVVAASIRFDPDRVVALEEFKPEEVTPATWAALRPVRQIRVAYGMDNDAMVMLCKELKHLTSITIECRDWSANPVLNWEALVPLASTLQELAIEGNTSSRMGADLCELAKLVSLRRLSLPSLNYADLDLDFLESMPQLQELLIGCGDLQDVSALGSIPTLRSVTFESCNGITDLSPLAQLKGTLTQLRLNMCDGITDASPLAALTSLTDLVVSQCPNLHAMPSLAGLASLKRINFSWMENFEDVSFLAGAPSLTSVDLVGCSNMVDLSGLATTPSVVILDLERCPKVDLGFLKSTSLQELSLKDCTTLEDVSALSSMTTLKRVNFNDCTSLVDISGLSSLTSLVWLSLNRCNLEDISALSSLTKLTYLSLSDCTSLSDISTLAALTSLESLSLNSVHSDDESDPWEGPCPLAALTALRDLNLNTCHWLQDLDFCKRMPHLEHLDIANCSSVDKAALAYLPSLLSVTVTGHGHPFSIGDTCICFEDDMNDFGP